MHMLESYRRNKKMKINCDKHGDFFQQVSTHKGGGGCRECGYELNGENTRKTNY